MGMESRNFEDTCLKVCGSNQVKPGAETHGKTPVESESAAASPPCFQLNICLYVSFYSSMDIDLR